MTKTETPKMSLVELFKSVIGTNSTEDGFYLTNDEILKVKDDMKNTHGFFDLNDFARQIVITNDMKRTNREKN